MSTPIHPHIVVGAGISGLGAAHFAAQAGVPTRLLEQASEVGGCIHSHTFTDHENYWVEAGSHSCFNSYGNLLQIMEQLNLLPQITAKQRHSYRLWQGGQRRSIFSALHPFELLWSLPRLRRLDKERLSVADYYRQALGARNYRDLFGPAFRSVVCQTADAFPAAALFRKKPRRKTVARNFTLPQGLSSIPTAIAAQPGIELQLNCGVTAISRHLAGGFELALTSGESIACQRLTLALPPDRCAPLLAEILPAAAEAVAGIAVVEIDTLLLLFERDQLPLPLLAGLIGVDSPFMSAVSRDFLDHPRYRSFAFHYPGGRYSEAERIDAACSALDVNRAQLAAVAHHQNRLPQLQQVDHTWRITTLDQQLTGEALAITGNWFDGVSIEDCLQRSHHEHQRLFG